MSETDKHQITKLLMRVNEGDQSAEEEIIELIYLELRRKARNIIYKKGRADPTFQTTELVHEAYMDLIPINDQDWENRKHFFGAAAKAMRRVLIRIARRINAEKRGGKHRGIPLEDWIIKFEGEVGKLSDIGGAIEKLYDMDRSWGQVVDMRFFGGFTEEETAEILGASLSTVERKWVVARAWLERELKDYNPYDR